MKIYNVMLPGTLVGQGHEVNCQVSSIQTTLDGAPSIPPEYSDFSIMNSDATARLPEGDYELLVRGERVSLRHKNGKYHRR